MKISKLLEYLHIGHEIEFVYDGKRYSITHFPKDGMRKISFCEFYQPDHEYDSPEDFIENAMIGDEKFKDIWKWIEDIDVF